MLQKHQTCLAVCSHDDVWIFFLIFFLYLVSPACQALELDSSNEKGLFRRGEAELAVNDYELARADFQKVLQLYPSNKAAKAQLIICQQKIREQHEREKKMYANMFQRLAGKEAKVSRSVLQNHTYVFTSKQNSLVFTQPCIL